MQYAVLRQNLYAIDLHKEEQRLSDCQLPQNSIKKSIQPDIMHMGAFLIDL